MKRVETLVIGAGPAGLTTAYQLSKAGRSVAVAERDPVYVGGISRTEVYNGYRFDIGGHRFFSKSRAVEDLWSELLGDDLLVRPRKSRIFYQGKFFDYPLNPRNALLQLGLFETMRCVLSYGQAKMLPQGKPENFEDWIVSRFGRRLFEIFFKTYTEKVWGMKCSEISADWAAQRIKGLDLFQAATNGLRLKLRASSSGSSDTIRTLIYEFRYPRLGPGQMWERARDRIVEAGNEVLQGCDVVKLAQAVPSDAWQVTLSHRDGSRSTIEARHVVSSAAITDLVATFGEELECDVQAAASRLKYRDFLIVALIAKGSDIFDDNWIYIHDPGVAVGRIQNFRSWSPDMVPDPAMACYGMEYFCFEGDGVWNAADSDLFAMAKREIERLHLCSASDIVDGCVVRQSKAYPVYDNDYSHNVKTIADALAARFPSLHLVGRNGMHKYNNQDHAMMTGMLTAENIIAGKRLYDVWEVNNDGEYHEAASIVTERMVPMAAGRRP